MPKILRKRRLRSRNSAFVRFSMQFDRHNAANTVTVCNMRRRRYITRLTRDTTKQCLVRRVCNLHAIAPQIILECNKPDERVVIITRCAYIYADDENWIIPTGSLRTFETRPKLRTDLLLCNIDIHTNFCILNRRRQLHESRGMKLVLSVIRFPSLRICKKYLILSDNLVWILVE